LGLAVFKKKELVRSHKLALDISYDLKFDDFVNRALNKSYIEFTPLQIQI